jgi:hypothetical protein
VHERSEREILPGWVGAGLTCPYGLPMRWDNKLTLLLEVSIVHFFPNLHSEKSTAII